MRLESLGVEFWVVVGLMVLAVVLLSSFMASLYRKAGPHEALIVYGFRGTRIVKGHGTVIFPMVEMFHQLSLELMSFDVAPTQDLYTRQGVAVTVEAVAQIKVKSDLESIQTAAEQFLTKTSDQRESLIRLVMEGHLRGIIGQLTVEQIVKEPEMVGERMRSTCADDMTKMGLEVVSFTIKEVRDKNEYIVNMGRPDVARIKRDADVAAAEADRDTAIKRAEAMRASAVAKAQADQERVLAETLSQAKQAESQRDLDIKKANYLETVKKQQAQADKAYEIQTNVMQQQVVIEAVRIQQIEREQQIKVQDAEIQRREKELIATVLKPAEVDRQRIAVLADAEKGRLDDRGRRPRGRDAGAGRGRSRDHLQERRRGGARHEREGRGVPGIQPGRRHRQAAHRVAGDRPRPGRAAVECGQDHDCVDRQRRHHRHAQAYRRHHGNGRAGAGPLRSAVGHADVGAAVESQEDRRQGAASRRQRSVA